jgi:cytochrome P450
VLDPRKSTRCPYAPLHHGPPRTVTRPDGHPTWIVTRHADVRSVLTSQQVSADPVNPGLRSLVPLPPEPGVMSILRMDDPEHARLRLMLAPEFSARSVTRLRPEIQKIADGLVDAVLRHGPPADFARCVARPLPSLTICLLLGVPVQDLELVNAHIQRLQRMVTDPHDGADAVTELNAYLEVLVDAKLSQPTDDVLGRVAHRHVPGGDLSRVQLLAMARLLLFAGFETTAKSIGMAMAILLRTPGLIERLWNGTALRPGTVDELLRVTTVPVWLPRVALDALDVGGCRIAKGDALALDLLAANHDESVFPDVDEVDVDRDVRRHLAFGAGSHYCLGHVLARTELEIALETTLARLPALRLSGDPDRIELEVDSHVYGVSELPIAW